MKARDLTIKQLEEAGEKKDARIKELKGLVGRMAVEPKCADALKESAKNKSESVASADEVRKLRGQLADAENRIAALTAMKADLEAAKRYDLKAKCD